MTQTNYFTRQQWATSLLNYIGNVNPSPQVVNWVVNWTAQEGNAPGQQAQFNLLNTTQPEAGSYGGGTQGNIQYYPSYQLGIIGNGDTLANGNYPDLYNALRSNNFSALSSGSGNIVQEMRTWGTGWNAWYGGSPNASLLAQQFPLSGSSITTPTGSTTGTTGSSTGTGIFNLPSSTEIASFFQRFMLLFFGGLIILIGISVVFFSSDAGKETVSTGAKAAAA